MSAFGCPHFTLQHGRMQRMAVFQNVTHPSLASNDAPSDLPSAVDDLQRPINETTGSLSDCPEMASNYPEVHKEIVAGKVLDVTGLFALTGEYRAGLAFLAAAVIAVKIINEQHDILPGYTIRINAHDTKVSKELIAHILLLLILQV